MKEIDLADFLELVQLNPLAKVNEIEEACSKAISQNIAAICVPPIFVKQARRIIKESAVRISTVVGYPIGFNAVESKLAEIVLAILDGADELIMTINITALINNDWQYLASELNAILPVVRSKNKDIIIDIQADKISADDLTKCCDLYGIAGVSMIQLNLESFSPEDQLRLIRQARAAMADATGLKVNTVINHSDNVKTLADNGVSRVGTTDLKYLAGS